MTDPTGELEQIYGTDICCNFCGDTGFIYGDEKYGKCEACYDEGYEEPEEELPNHTLPSVIKTLEELRDKADYRSRMIIDNGREIHETERAKSEGYASAYSFCILLLKQLEN
jgi:hypothetical protein